MILSPEERSRLLRIGAELNHQVKGIISIVQHRTYTRWLKEHQTGKKPGRVGRPRTIGPDVRDAIVRMAKENPVWGYRRIVGELLKLRCRVCKSSVKRILKEEGIYRQPLPPDRTSRPDYQPWSVFLKLHLNTMVACDFFYKSIWTPLACHELVERRMAYELEMFDDVWDAFWDAVLCRSVEELTHLPNWRIGEEPIVRIGAAGPANDIDSMFLFGRVFTSAAILLSRDGDRVPSLAEVRSLVQCESDRMGASTYVQDLLLDEGVRILAGHFCDADELGDDLDHPFWSKPGQAWVVERHVDGSRPVAGFQPIDEARQRYKDNAFDIVVDEVVGKIIMRKDGGEETHVLETLAGSQAGMLWLILTDDDGFIEHDEIKTIFGLRRDASRNQIHAYRCRNCGTRLQTNRNPDAPLPGCPPVPLRRVEKASARSIRPNSLCPLQVCLWRVRR